MPGERRPSMQSCDGEPGGDRDSRNKANGAHERSDDLGGDDLSTGEGPQRLICLCELPWGQNTTRPMSVIAAASPTDVQIKVAILRDSISSASAPDSAICR